MDIIGKIELMKSERNWTDYELAQRAMITQSTIASMKSRKSRKSPPRIETLQAICGAFGITLAQFFLEDESIEMLSEIEMEMLDSFRKLPTEKQEALVSLIRCK